MVPVELLVKVTLSGQAPRVGPALKSAAGTKAPLPVTVLVRLPPSLRKTTALLKLAAFVGTNGTRTLVEPKPARLKGVPDKMVNGTQGGLIETATLATT